MQKKKIKMRIMSFLLCILMVFTSIPLDAAAMSYSNSEGESNFLSMIDEELERFEASGETELYKDYAVEAHQNDLEDYQKADKLSLEMLADDSNSNDLTISIEKYDGEGNGSWLIKPKKIAKRQYYNDDVISAIREAYGANDFVQFESTDRTDGDYYFITSVYDEDQEDNYLANGEIGLNSKWEIYINNQEWSHTRYVPEYYLKAGDVVRLVYTTDNTQNPVATNRDELIKIIGEYAPEIWYESNVGYEELQAALNILVDLGATSEEIEIAKNNLINAFSATAVDISQGEEYLLGLDKTVTLKASVTPKNTKDKVAWSTDNANVATVEADTGVVKGLSEGTATIIATAGSVLDSIKVTVGKIPATNVVIKNEDTITIEKRFDVQLETEVTPAYTTDVVSWSSADENIATVDANGLVHGASVGSTTITATVGDKTDTCQIQVVDTTSPYVYFRYADGSVQEMVNNTFTLTALDVGKFVVGNYDEKVTWKCSDTGSVGSGGYEYRYWIDNDGDYNPFEVKKMQATVSGTGLSKSFYIDTVSSGISSIIASIGDKEVSIDNPYEVTGIASGIPVTVKGLNKNSEWVNVPEQAFKSTSTDSTGNIRVYAGLLDINTEGEAEITITMIDNADAKTSFKAKCNSVKVENIKVHAPENFVIDKWDSQGSGYVGITHGYESSNSEYYITYTPSNATNQEVIWEDLTPEIAEFHELHSAGIVPKKAGQARFKVVSQSNPDVSDEVSINFTYKAPLTNAVISKSSYEMEAGTSEDLVITMVPENATEQRFSWTYDKEGIVKVNESVSADTTTRYISRKIIALSNGKVTVTGTPLDSTGNCQPIKFEVTVGGGSGNVETIDYLEMAKADIKHGLSYLRDQINYNYGSEWTLFTYLRAGGTIENANNYFASVKTELNNSAQYLNATDYARLVITLPLLGQNPTNFAGFNLVEKLYNNLSLGSQTSNQISWTLLALDSHKYEIPDNAVWTREKLIEKILTFQAVDGGFGLSGNSSGSVDMTGMILQALAPYNTEEYPKVQSAFSEAVNYLKSKINENVGYIAEGGENGCTAAQVLTALSIAKIDPTNSANGFVLGNKNLITNLDSFKQPSGFAYLLGQGTNLQGTQQITYALEAYRRYAENENSLYDLMDIVLPGEAPEETAALPITVTVDGEPIEVTSLGERPYLSSSWKDEYTKPVYTVKVPANTDFVIGKTETGDGTSGINRVFAMADGVSMDGEYPYTMTAANLNNYYVLSTEEFVERVGKETGLDTNNKVAFIEVKDSNNERLYVLLVELISSGDDTPEDTMPIKAETLDGKKLTVTEKGKQSVKGKDVPVLEIGVYEGTTSVRVTPRDSYQVYDDMGSTPENASNLSTVPMFGDFYTLTKDGGRTVDYVIKFVIVEEKLLPIKAETLDGNPLNVTQNGEQVVGNASVPVLEIGIAEGIDAVKVIPSGGYQVYDDMGSTPENASNLSTVPMFGDFYTLTKDGGRTVDYVIKFVKTEPVTETFTVTLPTGEGYTATAEEGSTSPVEKGSDFSFTVKVLSGFKPGENFAVKANGTVLEPNSNDTLLTRAFNYVISLFNENEIKGKEYHYTIKDIQENQNITVENIERLTTTDNLAIISGDEVYDVSKLGNMSYKQADFGTVSDVPVYKATLPADADFEISWDANKDGGKTSSRYAFAIDAGGDMREKYYPLEMEAENIEAYVLTPEQIKKYFGEEISLNLEHEIAFIEIYDGEHIEADLRLLYGLFIEFAPEIVETFNVTLPTGDGYTVVPESTSLINKGESYSFEVKIDAAYDGSNMIVKANGNILEKVNGKYTIENVLADQIIIIEGVVPKVVGEITVKFAMFGDHVHAEGEEAIHTLYDGNLELWINAKDYNVSSNAKVIDVIDLAFTENKLTYKNKGNYISHVTRNGETLGEFTNGSLSGWMYTLNGDYSSLGVEEQGLKDGDIIVFYYTDDFSREDHSITLKKVDEVMGLIQNLPENITLDDEDKVTAAEEGYHALNEYQKILIRNYEKLAAAGKELAELKKSAEDEKKASKVEDFIDEIGEVTLSSKEKIEQAFAEYEKLTDIQKKLVDNYDELIAAKNKLILLENTKHEEVYRTTGDYLEQIAKESKKAVFGSEWVMFGLSRSGRKIPSEYIEDVASYVAKTIDGSGRLDKTKSTENSRLIYALTAAEYNAMDVAGYNLLSGLSDMKFVTKQGINGATSALIALQCHEDYEIPKVATGGTQTSVDALIDEILDKELTTGGWNLGGKEKPLDADVTAMAIQALAPYYNDASVKKAIDKALDELSKIQNEEGAFGSVDGASSESCAQVIVALTSLGINPETDTRFVKNGNSVVDALCSFYVEDGGFKHVASGELDGMASEQGYYAMAAYMRLLNNQTSLYDMNDVVLKDIIVSPNEPDTPDTPNTEISDADKKAAKQVEDIIDAIGRVTIYSENRIKEARKAYNNLTSAQKKLVSNHDVLLAAEEKYEDAKIAYVEDLIDSIGTVSLNSKTAINRARIAYNLLSAASKAEVYNYDKLAAAETLYAKLLSEDKNTVNKVETNKTNKTKVTTVKNSSIEKTKIAEYVDDLLESINGDSLNGEIFDAIMAYEELTDIEKISLDKENLVADLKQMLSEKIHVDQKTGILVSGAEWDVKLVVEDVSDIGRIQSMQDKMENAVLLGLWDISLVKMYGNEKYQPEETVLVKIPLKLLGDYASYEGLVIAHYTDDGQTEYLNCTIMGEYLVFNAIEFSDYAVIGYNDGSAFHDVLNGTDDYNGTAMEWIPWTIAGGCSMALLAVLFLMLKKRNEKINKENR